MVLILAQTAYLFVLFFRLYENVHWVSYVMNTLALVMSLYVIWRDRDPAYKIGWILLICLFTVVGVPLYALYGDKKPSRHLRRRIDSVEKQHRLDLTQTEDLRTVGGTTRMKRTVEYVAKSGPYPAWAHTGTRYYEVGERFFEDFLEDLAMAEHFIFLEYFIISRGSLWDEIAKLLKQKAAEGVDIRIIYDDVGSINCLPRRFVKEMTDAGIRVLAFNTVKPLLSLVYNNRDHRKIAVIDGYIGYTGGLNIGDEYANRRVRFGHWKDTGIRLYGNAVWNFTVMFLNMWNAFCKPADRVEGYHRYGPHVYHPGEFGTDGIVQPFSDTPLDEENLGQNLYMEILSQAEDYVFIYTPYLIPSSEMMTALTLAAKRGVDVRLVTPGIPDKPLIFAMTRSYYAPLMAAGVKIYEYTPGFIHAKSFVSDDRIAVVGSLNVDFRSLFLHFECGTLLVDSSCIADLRSDCITTFHRCHQVNEIDLKNNLAATLLAAVLRVFSPII